MDKSLKEKFRDEVVSWNNRFPVDKWWRDKHNIPFMSQKHRESCFLDQMFEYLEEKELERAIKNEIGSENRYIPNTGNWLEPQGKLGSSANKEYEQFPDEINLDD